MNYKSTLLVSVFTLLGSISVSAQSAFPPTNGKWTKGAPDHFKGDVWVEYFTNDTVSDFLSSRVMFDIGARSNWHKHSGKQIVFAVEGEGFYKEKGKPVTILKKGDVIAIEPGTIHSHGSINKRFTQGIMMNDIGKKESTIWLNQLLEEEIYQK